MKVSLDLDQLLNEGKITRAEYEHLAGVSARSTGSLAFNILIGFGVIAVCGGSLALIPSAVTAILIGLCILASGLMMLRSGSRQWSVLSGICVWTGALMTGGGVIYAGDGGIISLIGVTLILALTSIVTRSALLSALAMLTLSSCLGVGTSYFHASYFIFIEAPALTVISFTILAAGFSFLPNVVPAEYHGITNAASRAAMLLVNVSFWVGSLWGDSFYTEELSITRISGFDFALFWTVALVATLIWAWNTNRRWELNAAAVFGGIHFYTQWFEHLSASPITVLIAGLFTLIFAVVLRSMNTAIKENTV